MNLFPTQKQAIDFITRYDWEKTSKVNIAFLRNITLEPIQPFIRYYLGQVDLDANFHFCDFDNFLQPVLDSDSSLYQFNPDFIVISLKLEYFAEKFCFAYLEDRGSDNRSFEQVPELIHNIVSALKNNSNAQILVHNFEEPLFPALGIIDSQGSDFQLAQVRYLNESLRDIAKENKGVYLIDVNLIQSKVGGFNSIDKRYWAIGKAPYSVDAYPLIAQNYAQMVAANLGKTKKCIVLDMDNTLWGGILGEDGFNGIKIGTTFPGNAFREFQLVLLNYYHKGIILCACSKNNMDDVMEVLDNHPDMILKKEHFSNLKINWNDKVSNIKEISEDLNIGLDSMVFIDDSDFEVNLVREYLPQVHVIQASKDPTQISYQLLSYGFLDSLTFSKEDKNRTKMYQQEIERHELKKTTINMSDFLASLEMRVEVESLTEFTIPRVSQLTQRTNQFNLTTKRYSTDILERLYKDGNTKIYTLKVSDKFGDSGIVGVIILEKRCEVCLIDTLLMSCRMLGRDIEKALLFSGIRWAKKEACKEAVGLYIKTSKNSQVEDFYSQMGFQELENDKENSTIKYRIGVDNIFDCNSPVFNTLIIDGEQYEH